MDWLNDPDLDQRTAPRTPATSTSPSTSTTRQEPPGRRPLLAVVVLLAVVIAAALLPRLWAAPAPAAAPTADAPSGSAPSLAPVTAAPASQGATDAATASPAAEPEYLPPEDQQRLLDVAEAAMRAFARPTSKKVSHRDWFNRLNRYLTPEASEAYATTDPRNVPFTKVIGKRMGPIVDEAELTRSVDVGTNAGTYRVWISMLDFKVETFQPLEG